jgi:hypothetical protein
VEGKAKASLGGDWEFCSSVFRGDGWVCAGAWFGGGVGGSLGSTGSCLGVGRRGEGEERGGLDQDWELTVPESEVESMERAAVAAAVAAVLGLYMREEAVRGVYFDEEDDEEEQVVLYAKELQWWEEHTIRGSEGVLVPREVVPEVVSEEVPEEVEVEDPVPISHPTSHTVDLLPDPALEESEEESEEEEDLRRWMEREQGRGVKRGWEWFKDPKRKE